MTIVKVTLDLDKLGYTAEEFYNFVKDSPYEVIEEQPEYSRSIRNMIAGWKKIGTMKSWNPSQGPFEPGTYALVWDDKGTVTHPILVNRTFIFGESTREMHHRLVTHHVALRGKTSNMSDKYRRHLPSINEWAGTDITKNLDKVAIWVRPHNATPSDAHFESWRDHSVFMEQQAHGFYRALWGYGPIANTRDIPGDYLVNRCRAFLDDAGYETK